MTPQRWEARQNLNHFTFSLLLTCSSFKIKAQNLIVNKNIPGEAESYWEATTPKTNYPTLEKEIEVDVAVVGGGLAGLTAAYLLQEQGKSVAVLEAERIVQGVTGYTTAKITSLHTLIYRDLIDKFGKEKARFYGGAQEAAKEFIASQVKNKNIDCDFIRAASYTYAQTEEESAQVKKEVEAAKSLGLPATFIKAIPLPIKTLGAIKFDNQAHFHPRKYLLPLAEEFIKMGGQIFENSRVFEIEEGEPCLIYTEKGGLKAKDVIVATHFPILNKGFYFARLVPLRSYVFSVKIKGEVPEGMYTNAGDAPSLSVRPQPSKDGPVLIITGQQHQTGQEPDTISCYQELEQKIREYFPVEDISYHWSTQDNHTLDDIPYIGKYTPTSKHLYVATGFGGWGMTNGTVSGMILSDLILGKSNPWASLFDPARVEQFLSVDKLLSQNAQVIKNFTTGKFKRGSHCTHMGCALNFNNAEESWDCPCHGSRFSKDGKVLHCPAINSLKIKKTS